MMKRLLTVLFFSSTLCTAMAQTIDTVLNRTSDRPFSFAVAVSDGNYRVTVTLGAKKRAGQTVVRAESRRHFVDMVSTKKGKYETVTFVVNKHSPVIGSQVCNIVYMALIYARYKIRS